MQNKMTQPLVPTSSKQNKAFTLSELNPHSGIPVRIETRVPKGRYSVRFIGLYEQSGMLVTAPKTRKTLFTEGALLAVKMLVGNRMVSFTSRLLKAHAEPFPYWVLAYPAQMESQIFRQHTRVPIYLPVMVDQGEKDLHQPIKALCVDMSLQGASIESSQALAKVGDPVFITARVSIAGVDQVILVNARVKSVMQTESHPFSVYRQGVAFEGLEEDTRLVIAGYLYQQWLLEAGELLEIESFDGR